MKQRKSAKSGPPARKPSSSGDKPTARGEKPSPRTDKPAPRGEKPPFRDSKPSFRSGKPEPRGEKPPYRGKPSFGSERPAPRGDRDSKPSFRSDERAPRGDKPPYRGKPSFGSDRPAPRGDHDSKPPYRGKPSFGNDRPAPRGDRDSRPPLRSDERAPRGDKPAYRGKPSFGGDRPTPRGDRDSKPPFRSDERAPRGDKPAYRGKPSFGSDRPAPRSDRDSKPPYRGKPSFGSDRPAPRGDRDSKPSFRSDTPVPRGDKPAYRGKPSFGSDRPAPRGEKPSFRSGKPSYSDSKPTSRGAKPEYRGGKPTRPPEKPKPRVSSNKPSAQGRKPETDRVLKTLDRVLSKAGICSRAEARDWVVQGRMKVNGKVITDPEHWVDLENDTILLDGKPLREERKIYVLLYKPKGYLTTYKDPEGRPTVYNLLYDIKQWIFPVGRLDQDTSGLLLLTNDTDFAEHVTNPEHHVAKTYLVKTSSILTDDQIETMRHGLVLKDGLTRPAQVVKLRDTPNKSFFEITITEGRNRQVRRMVEALDSSVSKLVRTAIGPIRIEELNIGSWRYLTEAEVKDLRRAGGTPKKSARREWLAFEEGELEEGVEPKTVTPVVDAIGLLEPDDVEFEAPPAPEPEPSPEA